MVTKKCILSGLMCSALVLTSTTTLPNGGAAVGAGLFGLDRGTMVGVAASRPSREVVYMQQPTLPSDEDEIAAEQDQLKGQITYLTDAVRKLKKENARLKKENDKLVQKINAEKIDQTDISNTVGTAHA
ncbi:MAG: hypothetical protein UU47_C0001G0099 [candidate division TM6 bacterium GW2011_GWE2_41_16]|nr:MAG: hypothetical protein UU47_C0001G0099 [candidate division TM6 bacterium GW2011_GWE2_41_16]